MAVDTTVYGVHPWSLSLLFSLFLGSKLFVEVRLWSQPGARTKRPSGEGLCCPKKIANVLGTVSGIAGFDHQTSWRSSNIAVN